MTRPEIIRADSIDLQDREAPSAQEHNHPRTKPSPSGSLAPHQAETLREVAAGTAEENLRSPRVSWSHDIGDLQHYAEDLAAGVANSLNRQQDADADGRNKMQASQQQQQQDALAIAQNGGVSGPEVEDDGDLDGDADDGLDDDMMDKISSSPSIEDEDIDFEFVYALHTFVATVEGQANATKGDTMVLLDDSNSYWWLVRVVKDSSIGYLPAEHIETPTERLARLNKHRNIDLSATMLGDQAEKSRNPIKSAMKRRKTKTVQFAAPTYFDASDIDYSTDEEDLEAEFAAQQQKQQQQTAQQTAQQASSEAEIEDETAKVEPLKPISQQKDAKADSKRPETNGEAEASATKGLRRSSDELLETKSGDGPKKTSDGTVRDSFFKDDTVETKKITLTPNLLRDDNAPRASSDSKDLKPRPSLDKLDKDSLLSKDDKKKKDKKEKDKKPSAIRSFFSRKDKDKGKNANNPFENDDDSTGKPSMEAQEKELEEEEPQSAVEKSPAAPQRQPSKLQKPQPRTEPSPTRKPGSGPQKEPGMDLAAFLSESKMNNDTNVPSASMRVVDPDLEDDSDYSPVTQKPSRDRSVSDASRKDETSGLSKNGSVRSQNGDQQPQKATQATSRIELDDFDSDSSVEEITPQPVRQAPVPEQAKQQPQQQQQPQRPAPPGAYPDSYLSSRSVSTATPTAPAATTPPQQHVERLSESPVQVSPVNSNNPPPLMVDTSSQEEDHSTLRSSPSPELIEHEDGDVSGHKDSITTSTSATTTSTWNDTSLRAFFDSGSDIRDLLVVVYDKTDVEPAGPEHPVAGTLFREQNAKLAEITSQLDNMLGDWLARKQRLRGSV